MHITKTKLKQIIKEELQAVLAEGFGGGRAIGSPGTGAAFGPMSAEQKEKVEMLLNDLHAAGASPEEVAAQVTRYLAPGGATRPVKRASRGHDASVAPIAGLRGGPLEEEIEDDETPAQAFRRRKKEGWKPGEQPSPDEGGPSGISAKKDKRSEEELTGDV
ncbi:MAG: hypothetical protein CL398_01135 [Acidiferrobacteraceae bacterium]|nr:hypothetical protein [Acidiferrobacteraceae bacterium]